MTERRQATRSTPVGVPVEGATDGEVLVAPLPWRARIDLGKFIVQCYEDAINEMTRLGMQAAADKTVHLPLLEALIPYDKILEAGGVDPSGVDAATWDEMLLILKTVCELNGLMNLFYMLDPNDLGPSNNQETAGTQASDGTKTSPSDDSSAPESPSQTLSD